MPSKALHHGTLPDSSLGLRLPAHEIEQLVAHELAKALDDPLDFAERTRLEIGPTDLAPLMAKARELAATLRGTGNHPLPRVLVLVRVLDGRIELALCPREVSTAFALSLAPGAPAALTLAIPARLTRTGRAIRLVHAAGSAASPAEPDANLVRLVCRARSWWERIAAGTASPAALAAEEACSVSYVVRVLRLAFLSPAVLEALLEGTLKLGVDSTALLRIEAIPHGWSAQQEALLG